MSPPKIAYNIINHSGKLKQKIKLYFFRLLHKALRT